MAVRGKIFAVWAIIGLVLIQVHFVYTREYPEALLEYPSAKAAKYSEVEGKTQLDYFLDTKFPASGVIGWVSDHLKDAGWKPLTHDFLNPTLPSSQVQGWRHFIDGRGKHDICVHAWTGDWTDASGNVVTYAFIYRTVDCSTSHLTNLEVLVVYYPAQTAEQFRKLGGG